MEKVHTVSVFLDYKCNFACDHCSVGSSPETKLEMPEELWEQTFEQLEDLDPEVICFTGGEVTLHKERLLKSIRRASEMDAIVRIVTNGWWARDMESANEMVEELVDAGLDEMNTSYDDFHTDYMEVEPVINLVEAGLDSDLQNVVLACIVGSEDPEYDEDRIEGLLDDRLDQPAREYSRLTLLEDTAAPLGSGAQLDVSNLAARNHVDEGCNDIMSNVSIHPDGSVKVCCGHAQLYRPDLTLGNLEDESLSSLVDRGQQNLVYWLIHEVGPKTLFDRLDVDDDPHFSGICHACGVLLGPYREEFLEYVRENREELIREDVFKSDSLKHKTTKLVEHRDELMEKLDAAAEGDQQVVPQ